MKYLVPLFALFAFAGVVRSASASAASEITSGLLDWRLVSPEDASFNLNRYVEILDRMEAELRQPRLDEADRKKIVAHYAGDFSRRLDRQYFGMPWVREHDLPGLSAYLAGLQAACARTAPLDIHGVLAASAKMKQDLASALAIAQARIEGEKQ